MPAQIEASLLGSYLRKTRAAEVTIGVDRVLAFAKSDQVLSAISINIQSAGTAAGSILRRLRRRVRS